MNVPLPPLSRQPAGLFTPDFGQEPHLLVGREELLESLMEGLGAGPRDPRFTSLLLGPRGSGKTVILNHLGDLARQSGWIVLPLDAGTAGVKERIIEYIMWAQEIYDAEPESGTDRIERTSLKVRLLPLEWQREAIREVRPKWGLRQHLTTLAAHARQRQSAVLLILDEMHSGERSDLRRLSADLQHITKNEQLPLAFLGAGLSEMKHTLLDDQKMTFFARCDRSDMPPLKSLDAARFLAKTVTDAGGSFEGDALTSLSEASGSLPYKMQLVGHCAWMVADAPRRPIDDQAAAAGLIEANRIMHERVSLPVWHDLNEGQRAYLRRLAELNGEASPTQIAAGLDTSSRTLGRVLTHLTNAGCVTISGGRVRVADAIPLAGLKQIIDHENLHSGNEAEINPERTIRTRCNEVMPRAKAYCILTRGHAGAHRSR
ncbi:MAG: AAA family ATPase [bacterium]|nr:AAA family ATPase [bacterium]